MSTRHIVECTDCGWRSRPSTAGLAAMAYRMHSCDYHRAIVARSERRTASGEIRECHHGGRHQHGTVQAYVGDKCRCRPCRDASAAHRRHSAKAQLLGRPLLLDAEPARRHVEHLRAAGLGIPRVAELAGLPIPTVNGLATGRTRRIRAINAQRILAIPHDARPAAKASVDPTGTRRRLQALVAMGWSPTLIAQHAGLNQGHVSALAHGRKGAGERVRAAVVACYDQLWNRIPPEHTPAQRAQATRARRLARANGWVTPLAWNDEDLDNPLARPAAPRPTRDLDEVAVQRRADGDRRVTLSRPERHEAVRLLHAQRLSDGQIAARLGIDPRQVLRDRQALDLPPVVAPPARDAGAA